jgi:hypothetical protein
MRHMIAYPDKGVPWQDLCSECHWIFPLERLTDLGEFFQGRDAQRVYSSHVCSQFLADSDNLARSIRPDSVV